MKSALIAVAIVILMKSGTCSDLVANHPSSPLSLKSTGAQVLEFVNECKCDIVRFCLGCLALEGQSRMPSRCGTRRSARGSF